MTLKRSISQRIRLTLLKTKAKLSGGSSEEELNDMLLGVNSQTQTHNQYSPVRQNSATVSEESVDFPIMMANAPIYAQVNSNNGQSQSTNQSGTPVSASILPSNRKRSGSYARTRNISINSSSRNSMMLLDSESDSFKSIGESAHYYDQNDEILLLPLGPNDAPNQEQQQFIDVTVIPKNNSESLPMEINTDYSTVERPTLSLQNPSLTTSSTLSQSPSASSPIGVSKSLIPLLNSTPIISTSTANTTVSLVPTTTTITTANPQSDGIETMQANMDPLFIKTNQIDHLDKSLDVEQNDILAEQMALNILQNISEEAVDELSKLQEEISHII